jgi:halimadienyl-diphosphate synthase
VDYVEEAKELVKNLDQRMGPSPYDIAWMARLRKPDGGPRWPDLIEWLLENQRTDGSWGGDIVYYHDRIICTLAAIIALQENGHTQQSRKAIEHGERYLWQHLHLLPRDPFELVGFELIFPTLLGEARSLDLDVPNHTCGYGEIQTAKLRLIPPEKLYSPSISTVHSLEFLGESVDADKLRGALACNGSLGNSPATTSYYILLSSDEHAGSLDYLESVIKHNQDIIYLYPFRMFELIWVLNNLSFSSLPITEFADEGVWARLQAEISPHGIGLDSTFGIPDGDITAVCSRLLTSAGYDVDPNTLARFESEDGIFQTYQYERNPSVGTNVHALETLDLMPNYPNRQVVQEKITLMLLDNSIFNVYWIDKWHTSPYYATSHVIVSFSKQGSYLSYACHRAIDWLLHTQQNDGSWGFFGTGTAEETAYALATLLYYHHYEPVNRNVLQRGIAYLMRKYEEQNCLYPELWIGKCLYIPHNVVQAAILSTLILYENTFGCLP